MISARSYLGGNRSLVSRDGHATVIQLRVDERRGDRAGRVARPARRPVPRLRGRGHRRPHRHERLQHALPAGSRARRARVRAPGRARRAPPRLRRRGRGAGPGADGDPLDPGRPRRSSPCSRSSSASRSSSSTCSPGWGSRSGSTTRSSSSPATARSGRGGLEERRDRASPGATASRAVLFSGSTFVVALLGMLLVPTTIMRSLAAGAIIVGVVSVVAALTLLPALLGLLGDRVDRAAGADPRPEPRSRRQRRGPLLAARSSSARPAPPRAQPRPQRGPHARRWPSPSSACTSARAASAPCRTTCPPSKATSRCSATFPAQNPYPARIVVVGGRRCPRRGRPRELKARLAADPRFGPGVVQTAPRRRTSRCCRCRCAATRSAVPPSRPCATCAATFSPPPSPAAARGLRRRQDGRERRLLRRGHVTRPPT